MTEVQCPRTKSYVNDREFLLVSPVTGMLLLVCRPSPEEIGQKAFDAQTDILKDIVEHMNR